MEIQEKHRLEILNAKCNYVCAVDTLQKKMSYGEDVDCCINKLYLAQRLIGRLECFCFETPIVETEIKSQFSVIIPKTNALAGDIFQLIVDEVMVWSLENSTTTPFYEIFDMAVAALDIETTIVDNGATYTYTSIFDCNVTEVKNYLTRDGVTTITTATNTVAGACATSNPPCYNCIEVSDLPKMYEVLNKLLQ